MAGDPSRASGSNDADDRRDVVVLDRYRLLRKLGAGGMGAVFEAEHIHLGTKHAVKALQLNVGATLSDDQQRAVEERFLREAKICASVRHPNLVSVTDFGASGGVPYIVMDFIDGEDLQHVIDGHGALDAATALRITRDVASALGALHERGIIHRDLKPANIMVERESGRVLLTDLGIAKDTAAGANLTQGILGTPAYMAPEQMTDTSKTTPESDIYSLGVVMYAMLSGKDPFTGENPFAVLQQAREKVFTFGSMAGVAKQRDGMQLPANVESLLKDMTSYDRNKRCCKTREVVQRIATILDEIAPPAPEGHQGITMAAPGGPGAMRPASGALGRRPPTGDPSRRTPATRQADSDSGGQPELSQDTRNVLAALDDAGPDRGGSRGFAIFSVVAVLALGGLGAAGYVFRDELRGALGVAKPDDMGVKPPDDAGAKPPDGANEKPPDDAGAKPPDGTDVKPPDDAGAKPPDGANEKPPDDAGAKPPEPAFDLARAPESLRIALPGGEALEVMLVRPGSFVIGSANPEDRNARPRKTVALTRAFYIGRHEVTVGQYAAYLNSADTAKLPDASEGAGLALEGDRYVPRPGQARKPMSSIPHVMMRAFCKWLSEHSGLDVALPGEVEWEYAARGPESRVYPWGNEWDDMLACVDQGEKTDVGSYPQGRSWCGAEDMAGNVFEWCADSYVASRYEGLAPRDPDVEGPGSSSGTRVIRGGSYAHGEAECSASFRADWQGKRGDGALGFRVRVSATPALLDYAAREGPGDGTKEEEK